MAITSSPILEKNSLLGLLKIIINTRERIACFNRDWGIFILLEIGKSDKKISPDRSKWMITDRSILPRISKIPAV